MKRDVGGQLRHVDQDERRVLEKLLELRGAPTADISLNAVRGAPSVIAAVTAVLIEDGKNPLALMASSKIKKRDIIYSARSGVQSARLYIPEDLTGPLPVVLFVGGGWVGVDFESNEPSAMALSRKAEALVVSIDYRHAPEDKFPASHDDAFDAYKWILTNASSLGGDPSRIAVVGDSSGGNLAVNVAVMARDADIQAPLHLVAIYPVAGTDVDTPSYRENEHSVPLSKSDMKWFMAQEVNNETDMQDPRLDLVHADLRNLPPTTIITAEIDPLMSEGQSLAKAMRTAGCKVDYRCYTGMTHDFFGMAAIVAKARAAQDFVGNNLQRAFAAK